MINEVLTEKTRINDLSSKDFSTVIKFMFSEKATKFEKITHLSFEVTK